MGDFNANVGNERVGNIVGNHGLGIQSTEERDGSIVVEQVAKLSRTHD